MRAAATVADGYADSGAYSASIPDITKIRKIQLSFISSAISSTVSSPGSVTRRCRKVRIDIGLPVQCLNQSLCDHIGNIPVRRIMKPVNRQIAGLDRSILSWWTELACIPSTPSSWWL